MHEPPTINTEPKESLRKRKKGDALMIGNALWVNVAEIIHVLSRRIPVQVNIAAKGGQQINVAREV